MLPLLCLLPALAGDRDPVLLPTGGLGPPPAEVVTAPPTCQPLAYDPATYDIAKVDVEVTRLLDAGDLPQPPGYTTRGFGFGCASQEDYVLEVRTDAGERHLLLTHVLGFAPSVDGNRLYADNYVLTGEAWEHRRRIIDLASKMKLTLPSQVPCTTYGATWLDDRLLTYGQKGERTEICLFRDSGDPLHRVELSAAWRAPGSVDVLWSRFAALPADPEVLVHLDPFRCAVEVQDLRNQDRFRRIDLERGPDEEPWDCAAGVRVLSTLEGRSFDTVGQ